MRAEAYALSLLATPGVSAILRALESEPMPLADLRRAVGSPPQTTMRVQLRELRALGVLARAREFAFPRSVSYELADPGRELLFVGERLEHWLEAAPWAARLGDDRARRAVKALAGGWEAGIVGMLAARPRSLTDLSREISALSYPSLERRLSALRGVELIETIESTGRGAPCRPSEWLRRAAAPLAAASRFEHSHAAGEQEAKIDVQALLLLALPLISMPPAANGAVTLATRQPSPEGEKQRSPAEALTVRVRKGKPQSLAPTHEEAAESWALATPPMWLDALLDGEVDCLRFGGPRPDLAEATVDALHATLAGASASHLTAPEPAAAR